MFELKSPRKHCRVTWCFEFISNRITGLCEKHHGEMTAAREKKMAEDLLLIDHIFIGRRDNV
jgi:hypothetical protein